MHHIALMVAAGVLALAPAPAVASAAVWTQDEQLRSGLVAFVPPAPSGWETHVEPTVIDDPNAMEPSVSHGYTKSSGSAFMSITLTRPSPQDLAAQYSALRPGVHPIATDMVTSLVKVRDLDAYLIHNTMAGDAGYVLMMKVGRVSVGINGGDAASKEEIMTLAASVDLAALLKY